VMACVSGPSVGLDAPDPTDAAAVAAAGCTAGGAAAVCGAAVLAAAAWGAAAGGLAGAAAPDCGTGATGPAAPVALATALTLDTDRAPTRLNTCGGAGLVYYPNPARRCRGCKPAKYAAACQLQGGDTEKPTQHNRMHGDVALQRAMSLAGVSFAWIRDSSGQGRNLTFEMASLILLETGPRCRIGSALGSNTKSTSLVCTPKVLVMAHCCARAAQIALASRAYRWGACCQHACRHALPCMRHRLHACPAAKCARDQQDKTDTYM